MRIHDHAYHLSAQKTLKFGMGNSDLEKNFVTANYTCVQDEAKFPDEPS